MKRIDELMNLIKWIFNLEKPEPVTLSTFSNVQRQRMATKFMAITLTTVMVSSSFTSSAGAALVPSTPAMPDFARTLAPAENLGSIASSYAGANASMPKLIIISDLHGHKDVQEKIISLLGHYVDQLSSKEKQVPIYVEGGWESHLEKPLSSIKETKVRSTLAEYMLMKSELAAAQTFSERRPNASNFTLTGVEDKDEYEANRARFKETFPARKALMEVLAEREKSLTMLRDRVESRSVRKLRDLSMKYEKGSISTEQYVKALSHSASQNGIQNKLTQDLRHWESMKDGDLQLTLTEVNRMVSARLAESRPMSSYFRKNFTNENEIRANLSYIDGYLSLLKRVLANQLTPEEVPYALAKMPHLVRVAEILLNDRDGKLNVGDTVRRSLDFYPFAIIRNETLVKNSLTAMNQDSTHPTTGLLVAGGFHGEAIADYLREQKIAYLLINPEVSRDLTTDEQLNYIKRVCDEHITPAEVAADMNHPWGQQLVKAQRANSVINTLPGAVTRQPAGLNPATAVAGLESLARPIASAMQGTSQVTPDANVAREQGKILASKVTVAHVSDLPDMAKIRKELTTRFKKGKTERTIIDQPTISADGRIVVFLSEDANGVTRLHEADFYPETGKLGSSHIVATEGDLIPGSTAGERFKFKFTPTVTGDGAHMVIVQGDRKNDNRSARQAIILTRTVKTHGKQPTTTELSNAKDLLKAEDLEKAKLNGRLWGFNSTPVVSNDLTQVLSSVEVRGTIAASNREGVWYQGVHFIRNADSGNIENVSRLMIAPDQGYLASNGDGNNAITIVGDQTPASTTKNEVWNLQIPLNFTPDQTQIVVGTTHRASGQVTQVAINLTDAGIAYVPESVIKTKVAKARAQYDAALRSFQSSYQTAAEQNSARLAEATQTLQSELAAAGTEANATTVAIQKYQVAVAASHEQYKTEIPETPVFSLEQAKTRAQHANDLLHQAHIEATVGLAGYTLVRQDGHYVNEDGSAVSASANFMGNLVHSIENHYSASGTKLHLANKFDVVTVKGDLISNLKVGDNVIRVSDKVLIIGYDTDRPVILVSEDLFQSWGNGDIQSTYEQAHEAHHMVMPQGTEAATVAASVAFTVFWAAAKDAAVAGANTAAMVHVDPAAELSHEAVIETLSHIRQYLAVAHPDGGTLYDVIVDALSEDVEATITIQQLTAMISRLIEPITAAQEQEIQRLAEELAKSNTRLSAAEIADQLRKEQSGFVARIQGLTADNAAVRTKAERAVRRNIFAEAAKWAAA